MIELRVLGSTDLRGHDGEVLLSILSQPKRLALLVYLAINGTGEFVRRDKLLALFWGESEAEKGRASLRRALSFLRKSLGEGVVVTRGDEEVGIASASLECDALRFEAALAAGDLESGLAHYRGALLDGVHVSGAAGLSHWLDLERRRLMLQAVKAASQLADDRSLDGDFDTALQWARKAIALDPNSEPGTRRLIRLQSRVGDREGAVRTYEAFVARLARELDLEPSAETQALGAAIRSSGDPVDSGVGMTGGSAYEANAPAGTTARGASQPSPLPSGAVPEISAERVKDRVKHRVQDRDGDRVSATDVTSPGEPNTAGPRWPRASVAWLVAAGVVVAGGALLLQSGRDVTLAAEPSLERTAIAVLPFEDLTDQGERAYFADGLHHELLTQLSTVSALRVVSRTSVTGYTGDDLPPLGQIAAELGVGSVMEGSVQVVGGSIRVHVQLIDAETDAHLWAATYDRDLDDVFAIQSDIAQQVVRAVDAVLSRDERERLSTAPTEDAEAYRLYLQGRQYETRPGPRRRDLEIAGDFYQRALALDPRFALARASLSQLHGKMYWFRFDPLPERAARQRADAEEALRLDPTLPQAHVAMGLAHYWGRHDYAQAVDELKLGLIGLPGDSWLWNLVGLVHRRLGDWGEAIEAFEKAIELSPRDPLAFQSLAETLHFLRRYPEAVQAYDRALSLAPDHHAAAVDRAQRTFVLWRGDLDTLSAVLGRIPDAQLGNRGSKVGQTLRLLHWERQADSLLQILSQMPATSVIEEQDLYLPASLFAGWAHELRGDPSAAAEAFNLARVLLDSVLTALPDDRRVHFARGLALAELGIRDGALEEARWLEESSEYRLDRYGGTVSMHHRAQILARAGEIPEALDEIERQLAGPSVLVSVHTLRLDPVWDPLRGDPRFQAMLDRYLEVDESGVSGPVG